jgi:hypothetical protein
VERYGPAKDEYAGYHGDGHHGGRDGQGSGSDAPFRRVSAKDDLRMSRLDIEFFAECALLATKDRDTADWRPARRARILGTWRPEQKRYRYSPRRSPRIGLGCSSDLDWTESRSNLIGSDLVRAAAKQDRFLHSDPAALAAYREHLRTLLAR